MAPERKKLGEILIENGIISEMQLSVALGQQKRWGGKLGQELIRGGFIRETDLAAVLERQLGIKWVSLSDRTYTPELLALVRADVALKYLVVPIEFDGKTITLATMDPTDLKTLDDLQFAVGKRVKPVIATESELKKAIAKNYAGEQITVSMEDIMIPEVRNAEHKAVVGLDKHDMVMKASVESLVDLLVEKGIITMEELTRKITEKQL